MVEILGTQDTWDGPLVLIHELEGYGGVQEVRIDEATGKYVITYDPRRTHRDEIRQWIIQIGDDLGQSFEPIFDDR